MRIQLRKLITAVAATAALAAAPAHAFLQNWYFAFDGVNHTLINNYLSINGPSVVTTTVPVAGNFAFTEVGAINVVGHDGSSFPGIQTASNQVAALFNLSGFGNLGGSVAYTGGTISVYYTPCTQFLCPYGGTAGTFGVDAGGSAASILIGTFGPISGGGLIDPLGIPNGLQTIVAEATFLAPGYFFAPDNVTDLSTAAGNGFLFGFATVNASYVATSTSVNVRDEFNGGVAVTNCLPGQLTNGCTGVGNFEIGNGGQFRLALPEPGSLALLGIALLGLGVARRRKV